MGLWQAITSAMRAARESKGGRVSFGGLMGLGVGTLLTWLADRRRGLPTVRVTGVAENAVYPPDSPPHT